MRTAIVYSETLVHFPADTPYQLALVELPDGERLLVRIAGPLATIGDSVRELPPVNGIPFFEVIS
jgi:uncharacterized OB-fold protein